MNSREAFWMWFREHEDELLHLENRREWAFDQLASQLQKIDPRLTFEFGPESKRRELIISAGGVRNAFGAVSALVASAPIMDHWQVTAFRPRRSPPTIIELAGKRVDSRDVEFTLLDNGKTTGIYLFIPGYPADDADLKQIGYLLLDELLGEYDVEMKLGLIKMLSPEEHTAGERYPLDELPIQFDKLVSQLGLSDARA